MSFILACSRGVCEYNSSKGKINRMLIRFASVRIFVFGVFMVKRKACPLHFGRVGRRGGRQLLRKSHKETVFPSLDMDTVAALRCWCCWICSVITAYNSGRGCCCFPAVVVFHIERLIRP